jgi:hypothetical protein
MAMGTSTSIDRAKRALADGQRARIVQHACLRPAHEDDAAQMRFAVEDALNTADFADCGRLIVVRQLRLAHVPPRASAAWMARAMESAWRALAMQAVAAVDASPSTPVVYFASPVEARLAWLQGVVSAQSVDAWFWSAAMPELKTAAGQVGSAVDAVVSVLLRESALAFVAALKTWRDAELVALARLMPQPAHRRLLAVLAPSVADAATSQPAALRAIAAKALPDALLAVAARMAREAPVAEDAAPWMAALWMTPVLAREPVLHEVEAVVTRAVWMAAGLTSVASAPRDASLPVSTDAVRGEESASDVEAAVSSAGTSDMSMPVDASQLAVARSAQGPSPSWRMESGLRETPRRAASRSKARIDPPRGLPWLTDAAFTANGGLMLVLNVLRAMRFDSPSPAFVDALMVHLLDAVGAPVDEPQRAWLDVRLPASDEVELRRWRVRLRRTLRRHVRVDLPDLVRRTAWVSATDTHIDVVYPMSGIDLRLRRRGLDADPGWVPWFGRIVAFHFIDDELLPALEAEHG